MEEFLNRIHAAPPSVMSRMMSAVFMQNRYTSICDFTGNEVQGQRILITGGSIGVGRETAKFLVGIGAHVIIASRNEGKLKEAATTLNAFGLEKGNNGTAEYIVLDLSNLDSVVEATNQLLQRDFKLDQLIENAGVWPTSYSVSVQGYEHSFATNTLGHYLLRQRLLDIDILKKNAKVIVLTGDIYIKVNDATSDYKYEGDGEIAYCRSKLALHWVFDSFHEKYPELNMYLVHPGVIASDLVKPITSFVSLENSIKSCLLLTEEQGAQTTLIISTAPLSKLVNGGYYHNTCGRMMLSNEDPVNQVEKRNSMFQLVQQLCVQYMYVKE